MKKVTGIGGVFFKSKNPEEMRNWYAEHLGLATNQYGALFEFKSADNKKQYLQWSPMDEGTDYYEPSANEFMINYRVDDLVKLLEVLKQEGVKIVGEMQEFEYGKFAWIMDPEGRKIELWEPIDAPFDEYSDKGESTK